MITLAESRARWTVPVFCLGEFIRVVTHRKLFSPPQSAGEACEAVARMLASPSANLMCRGPGYPRLLAEAIR